MENLGQTHTDERERVLAVLKDTRDVIELGWTQHSNAVTECGETTFPWAENACKWCLLGGVIYGASKYYPKRNGLPFPEDWGDEKQTLEEVALDCLADKIPPSGKEYADTMDVVTDWNDDEDRTSNEVIDLLNRTIQELENGTEG